MSGRTSHGHATDRPHDPGAWRGCFPACVFRRLVSGACFPARGFRQSVSGAWRGRIDVGEVGDAPTFRDPVRFRVTDWGVSTGTLSCNAEAKGRPPPGGPLLLSVDCQRTRALPSGRLRLRIISACFRLVKRPWLLYIPSGYLTGRKIHVMPTGSQMVPMVVQPMPMAVQPVNGVWQVLRGGMRGLSRACRGVETPYRACPPPLTACAGGLTG
jgi:hypothetical protein